jgi:TonB family protein
VATVILRTALVVAWATLVLNLNSGAQTTTDFKTFESQKKNKVARVRHLLSDSKIRYDAAGKLEGKTHPGQWTWHSAVEVMKIDLKDGKLKIEANRVLLNYNRTGHKFASLRIGGQIEIEIQVSYTPDGGFDIEKEWKKAFLDSSETYPEYIKPYWRAFLDCLVHPSGEGCGFYERKSWEPDVYNVKQVDNWSPSYPGVDRVSAANHVSEPRLRSKTDPTYTEVARSAKIEGTVLLEAIVTSDGHVQITRIIRPIGWGLEENAADAISKWIFEPSRKNGEPVSVLLNIEVNFNLRR